MSTPGSNPTDRLAAALRDVVRDTVRDALAAAIEPAAPAPVVTWRERLWVAPDDTLMYVPDVAEALGRSKAFVYRRVRPGDDEPIPHRKLDGELVFTVEGVRDWVKRVLRAENPGDAY